MKNEVLNNLSDILFLLIVPFSLGWAIITINWIWMILVFLSIIIYLYTGSILKTGQAGGIDVITHELKNGDWATVLDEVLHILDVLDYFDWRYRFCHWAHTRHEK